MKLLHATPTVFPEVPHIVHSKPWDFVGRVYFRTFVGWCFTQITRVLSATPWTLRTHLRPQLLFLVLLPPWLCIWLGTSDKWSHAIFGRFISVSVATLVSLLLNVSEHHSFWRRQFSLYAHFSVHLFMLWYWLPSLPRVLCRLGKYMHWWAAPLSPGHVLNMRLSLVLCCYSGNPWSICWGNLDFLPKNH